MINLALGTRVASRRVRAGDDGLREGRYAGCPRASLLDLKVLDGNGRGTLQLWSQPSRWCIANKNVFNIRVISHSASVQAVDGYLVDPLCPGRPGVPTMPESSSSAYADGGKTRFGFKGVWNIRTFRR